MNQHWKVSTRRLANTHPGWLIAMVGGFFAWWPIGTLVLAYILWEGSMGRVNGLWIERAKDAMGYKWWSGQFPNSAFEEHKRVTLKKLEEQRRKLEDEERDFRLYMDRIRLAKDQNDFNAFLRERANGSS
jgi:Protein of unknown function (DUF2852)